MVIETRRRKLKKTKKINLVSQCPTLLLIPNIINQSIYIAHLPTASVIKIPSSKIFLRVFSSQHLTYDNEH